MNQVDRSFERVRGRPCWGVKRGYASFLTLEFGEPHLEIREPRSLGRDASRRVREGLARRLATVHGEWHLWIYYCDWVVHKGDVVVGDSSSARRIDRAAGFLNGQKLLSVTLRSRGARTQFEFDLGGRLETIPFDRKSEQWLLYEPSGKVLTLRADRKISYMNGDADPQTEQWRNLAV
jgi:hypothetical protein